MAGGQTPLGAAPWIQLALPRATPDATWHLGMKWNTVQQHPQGPLPGTYLVPVLFCDGSNTS